MCNVWKLTIKNPLIAENELSISEIKNLLEQLSRLGTRVIYLSGGEPLLKKGILSIIGKAKKEKFKVGMITNGTLITETLASKLLKSGLDHIIFSIDAPQADPHDQIRGVKGAWERAIRGIQSINNLRTKLKNKILLISIHFLVTRINYQLIEEMIECKPQLGYDEIGFLPVIGKTQATEDLFLRRDDLKALKEHLPIIKAKMQSHHLPTSALSPLISLCKDENNAASGKYGIYNLTLPDHIKNKILCFAPWNMATIDPFGNVYPCCYACTFQNPSEDLTHSYWGNEDFNMGDLKQNSFEEIWNGEKFARFREKCKDPPRFPMCESCGYDFSKNMLLTGLFKYRIMLLRYAFHVLSSRIMKK